MIGTTLISRDDIERPRLPKYKSIMDTGDEFAEQMADESRSQRERFDFALGLQRINDTGLSIFANAISHECHYHLSEKYPDKIRKAYNPGALQIGTLVATGALYAGSVAVAAVPFGAPALGLSVSTAASSVCHAGSQAVQGVAGASSSLGGMAATHKQGDQSTISHEAEHTKRIHDDFKHQQQMNTQAADRMRDEKKTLDDNYNRAVQTVNGGGA